MIDPLFIRLVDVGGFESEVTTVVQPAQGLEQCGTEVMDTRCCAIKGHDSHLPLLFKLFKEIRVFFDPC